jgi:hypothetical protein
MPLVYIKISNDGKIIGHQGDQLGPVEKKMETQALQILDFFYKKESSKASLSLPQNTHGVKMLQGIKKKYDTKKDVLQKKAGTEKRILVT